MFPSRGLRPAAHGVEGGPAATFDQAWSRRRQYNRMSGLPWDHVSGFCVPPRPPAVLVGIVGRWGMGRRDRVVATRPGPTPRRRSDARGGPPSAWRADTDMVHS